MEGQQVNLNFGFPPPEAAHVSPDAAQASSDSAQVSADAAQVSTDAAQVSGGVGAHVSSEGQGAAQVSGGLGAQVIGGQKKRGRPRKYGPDGVVIHRPRAAALSPMPISASFPLTGDFPSWKPSKGRSVDSFKKKNKLFHFDSPGKHVTYSGGANLIPHVITVNAGEDVNNKIISFSQQESRAICVLSANGLVSNVTLRQPDSSGGTLTYEGRFEILSLTGSFTPSDIGGTKSRSGGMSVSLAGPDGRVYGGGLAGLLVAAGPVQVVIGSFLVSHTQEEKPQKPRFEQNTTIYAPSPLNHHSAEAIYGGNNIHLSSENVINFQGSESNETKNGSHKFDISC